MRLLIVILLFSVNCSGQLMVGEMGILYKSNAPISSYTFISYTSATASSPYTAVTTPAINTTGANLIVIVFTCYAAIAGTPPLNVIADSKGNSYTLAKHAATSGSAEVAIFYYYGTNVGAGHTFSYSVPSSYPSMVVYAFSGASTSPLDQTNSISGTLYSGASTLQPGSVTPSTDGQLIITGINPFIAASSPTINGGFSTPVFQATNANQTYSTAGSYLIQGLAASANPTWSFDPNGSNRPCAAVICTFK